jgi:prefoldin subunit 5
MKQTRDQVRALSRSAKGTAVDPDVLRRQHQQIQEQLSAMQQNREQLTAGLSNTQKEAIQKRSRAMDQAHERIQNRLQEMDRELSGPNLNAGNIAEQARATEREMNSYQKEFQKMGDDLGLTSD